MGRIAPMRKMARTIRAYNPNQSKYFYGLDGKKYQVLAKIERGESRHMYNGVKNFNREECQNGCENCPFRRNFICTPQTLLKQSCDIKAKMFWGQLPTVLFTYNNIGQCCCNYMQLEDLLIQHCKINYPYCFPNQSIWDGVQYISVPTENSYEKNVREAFKKEIDLAAHTTKEKRPELSIMFDGIGLVMADDIVEAVSKVISILETIQK